MFERFGKQAQETVVRALVEARLLDHDAVSAAHLLLAVRASTSLSPALRAALRVQDITLERARAAVADVTEGAATDDAWSDGPYTDDAKQAFDLAQRTASDLGHEAVGAGHLLLAALRLDGGPTTQALERMDADADELASDVERILVTEPPPDPPPGRPAPLGGAHSLGISPRAAGDDGPRTRLTCGFCGRELGASDRFVAGEAALICGTCVRASSRIIDELP